MSKHCIHCGKELKNGEVSYCGSCYNELRTKGMFTTKKEKTSKK
jgi:hypothetical protein|nr:MAG TPA: PROTEIN/RNA Complex, archaeal, ribosomal, 50S, protein.0A [Caudoviricetes sp.]